MNSMWLADAKIVRLQVNGKPKYTLKIPEVFIRVVGLEESTDVALYLENGNLKVVPYEKE